LKFRAKPKEVLTVSSRETLDDLDELPPEGEGELLPDISLLSPQQQDRYYELADKLLGDKSPITPAEVEELDQLLRGLPHLGPHDNFTGPDLEIPDALIFHFKWTEQSGKPPYRFYDLHGLKAVQKAKFVDLCRRYGWSSGQNVRRTLKRLHEWSLDDRAEMNSLLDAAAQAHAARSRK
jgi:hypothetical protein